MQLLAVHYGGELYQDIAQEVDAAVQHVGVQHEIDLCADFLGLIRGHKATVASRHHQAVATLPEQFKPCAKAPDGVIEAMSYGNIYGVQWHPESDDTGPLIYKAFAETCRNA
jgi:putative glutamine amidotransferase